MLTRSPSTRRSLHDAVKAFGSGRLNEAAEICRAYLLDQPADPRALHLLGLVEANFSRFRIAVQLFEKALKAKPASAVFLNDHGKALLQLSEFDRAIASFEQAVAAQPEFAEAFFNLGSALVTRGGAQTSKKIYESALACFDEARRLGPDQRMLAINRGNVLTELGRFADAIAVYDAGIRSFGPDLVLLLNRAHALQMMERFDEALAGYEDALAFSPQHPVANANRGALLLRLGRLAEGWEAYDKRPRPSQRTHWPEWDGREAKGKRLLFLAEQGAGDTIQFIRFASLIAQQGADIVVEAPEHLCRVLRSAGVSVVARGQAAGRFDAVADLMSLPAKLGADSFAAAGPYLVAEPDRVARISKRLPDGSFNVGIAWQGNPDNSLDKGRSISLSAFEPLAGIEGVRLVSLQKNAGVEQLEAIGGEFAVATLGQDVDAGADAFVDTAAAIAKLDLVITSDTAIAHLAGALGRPVWIALQRVPDWRWMIEREDTPWYPTARLFRQRNRGDWPELFSRIKTELEILASAKQAEFPTR